jgi:Nuclease-related domain
VNYARRQQYRRLSRAATAIAAAAAAGLMAISVASAGALTFAGVLSVAAAALGLCARHWLRLAERSRIGARSEDDVRRVLAPLRAEGWRLRYALRWQGRGDIDSVAIAPDGVAFVIETKTRTYEQRQLSQVHEQAAWLWRRRRRWCRDGVLPVLCVVRAREVRRWEAGVLVVSIDWLTPTLQSAADVDHLKGSVFLG